MFFFLKQRIFILFGHLKWVSVLIVIVIELFEQLKVIEVREANYINKIESYFIITKNSTLHELWKRDITHFRHTHKSHTKMKKKKWIAVAVYLANHHIFYVQWTIWKCDVCLCFGWIWCDRCVSHIEMVMFVLWAIDFRLGNVIFFDNVHYLIIFITFFLFLLLFLRLFSFFKIHPRTK